MLLFQEKRLRGLKKRSQTNATKSASEVKPLLLSAVGFFIAFFTFKSFCFPFFPPLLSLFLSVITSFFLLSSSILSKTILIVPFCSPSFVSFLSFIHLPFFLRPSSSSLPVSLSLKCLYPFPSFKCSFCFPIFPFFFPSSLPV